MDRDQMAKGAALRLMNWRQIGPARILKQLGLFTALALAACTYGPAEDHVSVENVALKPDGSLVAAVVKYERYRAATGLAAFPDGGVPRMLLQRADLYVVSLEDRVLVFHGELPAGSDQKVSFSPWLLGWAGDNVYLEITGCPGDSGDPCYGPLRRRALYTWSPAGGLGDAHGAPALVLTSTLNTPARYVNVGVESYGVSSSTHMGVKRNPLMRFKAVQLDLVR